MGILSGGQVTRWDVPPADQIGNVGAPLVDARWDVRLNAHPFNSPVFNGYIGLGLINRLDVYASEVLGHPIKDAFSRYSPFWAFCQDIFQEWYLGDKLYTKTYGHPPSQKGKPGCIHFERPLLSSEQIRATLKKLNQQGYVLGFATGRTFQEAAYPLKMYGLLRYFDEQHSATYDYVERAEAELRAHGDQTLLSKPHPFQFLVALDHSYQGTETRSENVPRENFVVVGDSTSDILGGRAAGALTVAVLTGARTPEARQLLAELAAGDPAGRLAREAKAALGRLKARPQS